MPLLKFFVRPPGHRMVPHRKYSSVVEAKKVVEAPEYPEILDTSNDAKHERKKQAYFEKIKQLHTVEEKLFALNLPKFYGWPTFMLTEGVIPYNYLPFVQYITRTAIYESNRVPAFTDEFDESLMKEIKSEIEKVLIFEKTGKRFSHRIYNPLVNEDELPTENELKDLETKVLIQQLNNTIVNVLAARYPHLFAVQTDYNPLVRAFWRVGGFHEMEEDRKLRDAKRVAHGPIDRMFQYDFTPFVQLRSRHPLPDASSQKAENSSKNQQQLSTGEEVAATVPPPGGELDVVPTDVVVDTPKEPQAGLWYPLQEYRYDPGTYFDVTRQRLHGAVTPGFWPNDPNYFGLLSFHSRKHMIDRPTHYGFEDEKEAVHSQAVLASFAWLYGQACYQGFTTYNDITYPFNTQTVITDGQLYSFYQYQLNTIVLHSNNTDPENKLQNECYGTDKQELYHEIRDNQVQGWNDETLFNLLSMYANVPRERPGVQTAPYLDPSEPLVANIVDVERRVWLHNRYRFFMTNRPRSRLAPEIYDWERIYKIDHKMRPRDPPKRFFEMFRDPINDRKMYEHAAKYIPRALRDPKVYRAKFENVYYPDVLPDYHEIV